MKKQGLIFAVFSVFPTKWQGGIKYAKNERVWFCLFLHKIRSCWCFMQETNSVIAIVLLKVYIYT